MPTITATASYDGYVQFVLGTPSLYLRDSTSTGALVDGSSPIDRSFFDFVLSAIPKNSTITNINFALHTDSNLAGNQAINIRGMTGLASAESSDSTLYESIGNGVLYLSAQAWGPVGSHNANLPVQAIQDAHQRGFLSIGVTVVDESTIAGDTFRTIEFSSASATSRPRLVVDYRPAWIELVEAT